MAGSSSSSAPAVTTTSSSSTAPKLTCLCSPTNHPGSFRCSRHRNNVPRGGRSTASSSEAGQRRGRSASSAKGRSERALLLEKIASPSADRRHRGDFQPRPSRLRLMNK